MRLRPDDRESPCVTGRQLSRSEPLASHGIPVAGDRQANLHGAVRGRMGQRLKYVRVVVATVRDARHHRGTRGWIAVQARQMPRLGHTRYADTVLPLVSVAALRIWLQIIADVQLVVGV